MASDKHLQTLTAISEHLERIAIAAEGMRLSLASILLVLILAAVLKKMH